MTTLYNLTHEYQKLLAKEEYNEADMLAIENIHESFEDKIIGYACVIQELNAKKNATDDAIKIAIFKSKKIQKNIDYLEEHALNSLAISGISKIDKHPLFDIKVQTNRASVEEYDLKVIPEIYWSKKEVLSLDKNKIKADIENLGLVIPGVKLINKKSLKIG